MKHETLTETYHGFVVNGCREYPTRGDYDRWFFQVSRSGAFQFRCVVKISGTQGAIMGEDDAKVSRMLRDTGLRQVHGKIDLNIFQEGEETEYVIGRCSEETTTRSDDEIQLLILQVLDRIRRLAPDRFGLEQFDAGGFCDILGIGHSEYLANATLLRDEGYIADSPLEQVTIDKGGLFITPQGVRRLAQLSASAIPPPSEETRDEILRIMYENEKTGAYDAGLQNISAISALELDTVRYHIEVLESESYVSTESSTFGAESAKLTTIGKRRVVEGYRREQSTAEVTTRRNVSINIQDSTVNTLNTGEIGAVNNISNLVQAGQLDIADALKNLTEAVINSQEISTDQRSAILDNLEMLSEQATLEPGQRAKLGVIRSVVSSITTAITTAGGLAEVWATWGPVITKFFGGM